MGDNGDANAPAMANLADEIAAALGTIDLTTWVNIPMPDLRNGDPNTLPNIAPSQSIPDSRKWVSVRGGHPLNAEAMIQAFIWAQYGQLVTGTAYATDEALRSKCRKLAIIMGAVRASAYGLYRLAEGDMTRSECVMSAMTYHAGLDEADLDAARAALVENPGIAENLRAQELANRRAAIVVGPNRITFGNGAQTMQLRAAQERNFGALTIQEKAISRVFAWMGAAVPVLQGVSLIHSGHHYIPPTYKIFEGILKQADFLKPEGFTDWVSTLDREWKGAAFHDATHPISPDRKREWAKSQMMKLRMDRIGLGSAAIRLPGLPAGAQSLKAGLTCIQRASDDLVTMGATVSTKIGEALLTKLEGRPRVTEVPTDNNEEELDPEVVLVDHLTDAELEVVIKECTAWYSLNQANIALSAGLIDGRNSIAQATSDTRLPMETTTAAKSVKKAIANNTSKFVMGQNLARALNTLQRAQMERGDPIKLVVDA